MRGTRSSIVLGLIKAIFVAVVLAVFLVGPKTTRAFFEYPSAQPPNSDEIITPVSGQDQVIAPSNQPAPIVVKASDSSGAPLSGRSIEFIITDSSGATILGPVVLVSDSNGLARLQLTEQLQAGKYNVQATLLPNGSSSNLSQNGVTTNFPLQVLGYKNTLLTWVGWLIIAVLALLAAVFIFLFWGKGQQHFVHLENSEDGVGNLNLTILNSESSKAVPLVTNEKGFFRYQFEPGEYAIKIDSDEFELSHIHDHPETEISGNSGKFTLENVENSLKIAVKKTGSSAQDSSI